MSWEAVACKARGGRPRLPARARVEENRLVFNCQATDLMMRLNKVRFLIDREEGKVGVVPSPAGNKATMHKGQYKVQAELVIRELDLDEGEVLGYAGQEKVGGRKVFVFAKEVPSV